MLSNVRTSAEYFRKYVRNPRVSNEMLTPYKAFFRKVVSKEDAEAYVAQPMKLVEWVAGNIRVDKHCNLGGDPISPEGVWRRHGWQMHTAAIFSFVSMARSMGIPARIDEVTGKVQLMKEEGALDVDLDCKDTVFMEELVPQKGRLVAEYSPVKSFGRS